MIIKRKISGKGGKKMGWEIVRKGTKARIMTEDHLETLDDKHCVLCGTMIDIGAPYYSTKGKLEHRWCHWKRNDDEKQKKNQT